MFPDFQLPTVALATAVRLTKGGDEETLRELLEMHAGKLELLDETVVYYRPFYTSSVYLRANPQHVRVLGGGADRLEFDAPTLSHATLLDMQAKEDSRLKLDVPLEYQVNRPAGGQRVFAGVSR